MKIETKPTASNMIYLLALRVVLLAALMMLFNYLSVLIAGTGFFADYYCPKHDCGATSDSYNGWGYRHYVYFWMCIVLFILSIIRILIWAFSYHDKII